MRILNKKPKQGLDKVKFWLVILIDLLVAAASLRIGAVLPKKVTVPDGTADALWEIAQPIWQFFVEIFHQNPIAFWVAAVIGLTIGCLILYACHRYSPKKRRSRELKFTPDLVNMQVLLYIATASLLIYSAKYNTSVARMLSFEVGILTVATVVQLVRVLQDVYVKRNSPDYVYFEEHKKTVLIITTLVGLALVGLPVWVKDFWGFTLPRISLEGDLLGYYTALLSLTFISISVMGVLSDRSVVIYWENIAEAKLIKPVFGSFAAYTYYSIGAAVGAGICVALDDPTAFVVLGTANIVTMILLTFAMVDVYYDRAGKKVRLEKELQEDAADYKWVIAPRSLVPEKEAQHNINPETNEEYTPQEIQGKHIGVERYKNKMKLLSQNIHRAQEENDLMYLEEVHELYRRNLDCFNTLVGKPVGHMLFAESGAHNWLALMESMQAYIDQVTADRSREEDPFGIGFWKAGSQWNRDEAMWAALTESAYLRKWLRSTGKDPLDHQELQVFMKLVFQRLVALYNDMVTHSNLIEESVKCEYLQVTEHSGGLWIDTEQGEKPDPDQISLVFHDLFGEVVVESTFAARLMRVLYVMLENLEENPRTTLLVYLNDFPLPNMFTPFMATLGFTEEEAALWETHFPAKE